MNTKPHHQTKRSLVEAFGYRGCPICYVLDKDESDFMATLQYQTFNEEKVRQDVVMANGYCNFHFHQMARMASPMGIAILTKELIAREVEEIEGGYLDRRLSIDCPICKFIDGREEFYIKEFKSLLYEEFFKKKYEATDGLCRIHFRKVISLLEEKEMHQFMFTSHLMHLRLLKVELETYISKIRSTRDFREEKDSWWVAIEKIIGKKGLNT
jgi:hypothetical protein